MTPLEATLLSNAIFVLPLAIAAALVTRLLRRPALAWALWGIVLLKFVTPAVVPLPVPADFSETTSPVERTSHSVGRTSKSVPNSNNASIRTDWEVRPTSLSQPPSPLPINTVAPSRVATEFQAADESSVDDARAPTNLITFNARVSDVSPLIIAEPPPTAANSDIPRSTADSAAPEPVALPDVGTAHTARGFVAQLIHGLSLQRDVVGSLWLAGSVLLALLCGWRVMRFHRLLRRAEPASPEVQSLTATLAGQLELRRVPTVRVTDGRVPPLLWAGFVRPTILLPRELFESLDADGRRALLAHELTHVARRDHWTRWLEMAVRCLYWWHPVAWWAGRRLREAEEQCCDAQVVALTPGSAKAYARAVMATVDFLAADPHPVPILATGLRPPSPLRRSIRPLQRRLQLIVTNSPAPRLSWPSRLLMLALAALILPAALIAQSGDTEKTTSSSALPAEPTVPADELLPQNPLVQQPQVVAATPTDEITGNDRTTSSAESRSYSEPTDPTNYGPPLSATDALDPYGNAANTRRQSGVNDPYGGSSPDSSRFGFGAGQPSALQPVDQTRPEALTAPEDYEEITVVAEEYALPTNVARALQSFLGSVEAGFPVLVTSLRTNDGLDEYGNPKESYGGFGVEPRTAKLRVIAPAAVQDALGGFLKSMQQTTGDTTEDAKTITLVRAEYSMPSSAVDHFAGLVESYQQSGLVMPLVVKRSGNKLSLTATKQVHEHIRKFITFLGENWKSADLRTKRVPPTAARFSDSQGLRNQPTASREVLEFDLQIAQRKVELAEEKVDFTKRLITKGYKNPADVAAVELELLKAQRAVKQLGALINSGRQNAESRNKNSREAAKKWLFETTRDIASSVDLTRSREKEVASVIEDLKRREESASPDNADTLRLIRNVFELIQTDMRRQRASEADPEEVKQARGDVIRELNGWGLRIEENTLHNDLFGVFVDYLMQLSLGDQKEFVPSEDQSSIGKPAASQEVLEFDLQIAQREVELAEEKLARTKQLATKGFVAQSELGAAERELLKTQRAVKQLEALIDSARETRPGRDNTIPEEFRTR